MIKGKNVILLDDVLTSGSSLKAGIRILKKEKPNKIIGLAVARKVYLKDLPMLGIY
jgi:predicted amidophosphoribosyltransferase